MMVADAPISQNRIHIAAPKRDGPAAVLLTKILTLSCPAEPKERPLGGEISQLIFDTGLTHKIQR